jgi:hypothetical protein
MCMFCRSLFVLLYFFLLAIVLSVFLRYTDSDSSMPNLGFSVKCLVNHCVIFGISSPAIYYTPTLKLGLYCNHLVRPSVRPSVRSSVRPFVCPSVCPSVRSHFRNRYLSFYWKKWFYTWYMALAWWLVPCLPFPGLPHIYFLFTVRLTNERVGVFLARHSVQHLFLVFQSKYCEQERCFYLCFAQTGLNIFTVSSPYDEHRSSGPRPENLYFDQ